MMKGARPVPLWPCALDENDRQKGGERGYAALQGHPAFFSFWLAAEQSRGAPCAPKMRVGRGTRTCVLERETQQNIISRDGCGGVTLLSLPALSFFGDARRTAQPASCTAECSRRTPHIISQPPTPGGLAGCVTGGVSGVTDGQVAAPKDCETRGA